MKSAYEAMCLEAEKCAGEDVVLPNGTCFVRHLTNSQALRYLHKIYAPLCNSMDIVSAHLGFSPPVGYEEFLTRCGGASLFDQTMHLFGYDASITRSTRLEDQRPIYIGGPLDEYRSTCHRFDVTRWSAIGSVVLYGKVWLVVDANGLAGVVRDDHFVKFSNFDEMIVRLLAIISTGIGCGPAPSSGNPALEESIFSSMN